MNSQLDFTTMQRGHPLWVVKGTRFSSVRFCCVDKLPGHFSVKVLMSKRTKRIADGLGLVDANGKKELEASRFAEKYSQLLADFKAIPTLEDSALAQTYHTPKVAIIRLRNRAKELGLL